MAVLFDPANIFYKNSAIEKTKIAAADIKIIYIQVYHVVYWTKWAIMLNCDNLMV